MEDWSIFLIEFSKELAKQAAKYLWNLLEKCIKKATSTSGKRNRGGTEKH